MKTIGMGTAMAVVAGAWMAVTPAAEAVIFDLSPVTTTVAAGSYFDITFTANTQGATMVAYEFNLAVNGLGSGMFEVTGRSTTGSPFSDVVPGTHTWPDVLNPETDQLFGGSVPNVFLPAGPGTNLFLSTLTIHTLNSVTPGTYTISMTNWQVVYGDFSTDSGLTGPGTAVTINAIPEPASLALLLAVSAPILLRRRRA